MNWNLKNEKGVYIQAIFSRYECARVPDQTEQFRNVLGAVRGGTFQRL